MKRDMFAQSCDATGSRFGMYEKEQLFAWEEYMKKKFIFAREHKKSQMPEEIIRLTAEK